MTRVLPGFSHQKSVKRLIENVKKIVRKEEIKNKGVYEAVVVVEKKTNRKGAAIIKFKDVSIQNKICCKHTSVNTLILSSII